MKDSILYYSVGPLLYCPANHKSLANSLIHERFGRHFSLAVCLEDTIQDDRIAEAEHELVQTIHTLFNEKKKHLFFLPKIFIRVRSWGCRCSDHRIYYSKVFFGKCRFLYF